MVGILDEPDYTENQRIRDWLEMKSKDQKIELTGTMMKSEHPVTSEETVCLNGKEVMFALKQLELPSGSIKIWDCPEGYQFVDENGNVINTTKIVLEKKKKEYPQNPYDCAKELALDIFPFDASKYKRKLIHKFQQLLICRDAYWKIAGEEMGLGKPWEPDWDKGWYAIANYTGNIITLRQWRANAILAFPTEEMRDAFYENFKELVESVKELL